MSVRNEGESGPERLDAAATSQKALLSHERSLHQFKGNQKIPGELQTEEQCLIYISKRALWPLLLRMSQTERAKSSKAEGPTENPFIQAMNIDYVPVIRMVIFKFWMTS